MLGVRILLMSIGTVRKELARIQQQSPPERTVLRRTYTADTRRIFLQKARLLTRDSPREEREHQRHLETFSEMATELIGGPHVSPRPGG